MYRDALEAETRRRDHSASWHRTGELLCPGIIACAHVAEAHLNETPMITLAT
jgi:hypothetical protein